MLILVLLISIIGVIDTQVANPYDPPYGCANFGACNPSYIRTTGNSSTDYYYCLDEAYCLCNNGTSGANCTTVENNCAANNCTGNATCVNGINSFSCTCNAGYTGDDCDIETGTVCASSPCMNGGTCSEGANSTYSCSCPSAYLGERCQYANQCLNSPCINGGTCSMIFSGETFYCTCTADYQGRQCRQNQYTFSSSDLGCYKLDEAHTEDCDDIDLGSQPTVQACYDDLKAAVVNGANYTYYSVVGTTCCLSAVKPSNQGASWGCSDQCQSSAANTRQSYNNSNEICGSTLYSNGHTWAVTVTMEDEQCATIDCGTGVCVEYIGNGACICPRDKTWSDSNTKKDCSVDVTPCTFSNCTGNANCTENLADFSFKCVCPSATYYGDSCQYTKKCTSSSCLYGGTCVDSDGAMTCECLEFYTGANCQLPNYCEMEPCIHGTCSPVSRGLNSTYKCTCEQGWKGSRCQTDIDECASSPCLNQGTCTQVKPPAAPWYNCTCNEGTSGDRCENNPDDCPYQVIDGVKYSACNSSGDTAAICVDGCASYSCQSRAHRFNSYSCNCSADYTGDKCDISMLVYQVMMDIYGSVDGDMLTLLNDLVSNPAMIKDMVPFILGLESMDNRTLLSWTSAEMFDWAAFEEKTLNLSRDFYAWNDVVLGNCFTFNHRLNPTPYAKRSIGKVGGLKAKLRVHADEYLPWIDTEAITVFVHPPEEYIFSESVRYSAPPAIQSEFFPVLTEYQRLGGKYGVCVNSADEVKSFYFYGGYTTDGCIRSCYQDKVFEQCGCMDPRFPMPTGTSSCDLKTRTCVEAVSDLGDPSLWPTCVCPLPCSNRLFTISISRSPYVSIPPPCLESADDRANCTAWTKDTVVVEVNDNGNTKQIFAETPAMSFNTFIGKLGGLLGVLMGVSCITFIEFGFLFIQIGQICVQTDRAASSDPAPSNTHDDPPHDNRNDKKDK